MPEYFSFLERTWNVTLAKELAAELDADARAPVKLMYETWLTDKPQALPEGGEARPSGKAWVIVDEQKALSAATDLDVPLIAVELPETLLIIDGWHRIYKAYHAGISELKCRVLPPEPAALCEVTE